MNLPKQVQEAEARSQRAIDEFQKGQQPPAADTPPADPPKDPPDPPPSPSASQEPPPADPADRQDWKAKYYVLQGKYNAEVPRLHADLKAANERLETLAAELAELKANATKTPAPAPAAPPTPTAPPAELVAALGEDGAAAMMRIISEGLASARKEIGKDIEPVKAQAENATKTAEQIAADRVNERQRAFTAALTERVPDWRDIDQDERWHAYLAGRSREARRPRQELIAEAYRDGDVDAVVGFFEAFKEANGLNKPADPPPPAEPAPPHAPDPALARQQVPDTSGRSAVPADKKIWTRAEIKDTYKQIALGKIPAEQAKSLEADIDEATREGRIR